jgi:hypothetical protein
MTDKIISNIMETFHKAIKDYSKKEQKEITDRLDILFNEESLYDPNFDDVPIVPNEESFKNLATFIEKYKRFRKSKFSIGINSNGTAELQRNYELYAAVQFKNGKDVEYRIREVEEPFTIIERKTATVEDLIASLKKLEKNKNIS